jgi:hypothetical protein
MGQVVRVEEGDRLLLTVVEAAATRVPRVAVHRYVEALLSPPRPTMRPAPRRRNASQPPLPFVGYTKD